MSGPEFGRGPLRDQVDDAGKDLIEDINKAEEARLSQCLGRFMAESLVPPEIRRPFWSFKEIWKGSQSFPYGWRCHDLAFPRARYVHVIRHPLTWVQSYFANLGAKPLKDDVIFSLKTWV